MSSSNAAYLGDPNYFQTTGYFTYTSNSSSSGGDDDWLNKNVITIPATTTYTPTVSIPTPLWIGDPAPGLPAIVGPSIAPPTFYPYPAPTITPPLSTEELLKMYETMLKSVGLQQDPLEAKPEEKKDETPPIPLLHGKKGRKLDLE